MKKIKQLLKSVSATIKAFKKSQIISVQPSSSAERQSNRHHQKLHFDDYGNPLFI